MKISFHINFNGECREAFEFYRSRLGAKIGTMLSFGQSPMSGQVPLEWQEKIVHANIQLHDVEIAGGDVISEQYEARKDFALYCKSMMRTQRQDYSMRCPKKVRFSSHSRRRSGLHATA